MTLQNEIKGLLWDKTLPIWRRKFLKVVLGEFDRVDDGKPIGDEEAIKVMKKMEKSTDEMIGLTEDTEKLIELTSERAVLKELLPVVNYADIAMMEKAIYASVPAGVKNRMSCMKPCIQYLEDKGYEVDKKELAKLLKG